MTFRITNELPGTGNGMIEMNKGIEDEVHECDHHDIEHNGVVDYGDGTNITFEVECLDCGSRITFIYALVGYSSLETKEQYEKRMEEQGRY